MELNACKSAVSLPCLAFDYHKESIRKFIISFVSLSEDPVQ